MSEWLKTLLGVDADDIPADAVTSFQWGHLPRGSAALLLLLFVIAIVAGVIWIYRREGGAPTKAKIVLATLRAMVLLAAVVLLLEPVLAVDQVETIEKSTIVLVDDSLSMTTKDRYLDTVLRSRISNALGVEPSQMERSRLVEQALKSSGLYASLANQNSVEIFRFAGSAVLHVTLPRQNHIDIFGVNCCVIDIQVA